MFYYNFEPNSKQSLQNHLSQSMIHCNKYNNSNFAVLSSEQRIQKTAFTIGLFFPTSPVKITEN